MCVCAHARVHNAHVYMVCMRASVYVQMCAVCRCRYVNNGIFHTQVISLDQARLAYLTQMAELISYSGRSYNATMLVRL